MSIDFSDLDPLVSDTIGFFFKFADLNRLKKQTLPPTSNGTPSRNGVYEEESSTFSLMNEVI